ncbi:methicillin resistance protein [Pelovirga terrestris]|uniref:Methicillin resistance protein n=1 Tax=Pelovirga terrestris TaxID=2771352 RepID=A0A8J6QPR3_9BACT|nr:methicillin resistance protein [Pelovirga terrestris]MBD1399625.1 methicillin resistance protein [Pelovirga terrestris]
MMGNKEEYRKLCKTEQSLPVWNKDWWLDAVCGDDWQVLTVEKGGEIFAALPYVVTKGKFGLRLIKMPKLTQTLGVWAKYPDDQKYLTRISYEKEIYTNIIEQLEALDVAYFHQNFSHKVTNWLPFMWKGYEQTTRYTYIIDDLTDIDVIFKNFNSCRRQSIRKAEKTLKVGFDLSSEDFYNHHMTSLEKKGKSINYKYNFFKKMYDLSYENNSGKTLYCYDNNNNIHAAVFLIMDRESTYALIGSVDIEFTSGGSDLLIFEAIKYASKKTKMFDFEGSVIENIEMSYRNFGGKQVPYFSITKTHSPYLMINDGLQKIISGTKKSIKKIIKKDSKY